MATRSTTKTRERKLSQRFQEIEAKYTDDGTVHLGNATPEELRELGRLTRELEELRAAAAQPEEATA